MAYEAQRAPAEAGAPITAATPSPSLAPRHGGAASVTRVKATGGRAGAPSRAIAYATPGATTTGRAPAPRKRSSAACIAPSGVRFVASASESVATVGTTTAPLTAAARRGLRQAPRLAASGKATPTRLARADGATTARAYEREVDAHAYAAEESPLREAKRATKASAGPAHARGACREGLQSKNGGKAHMDSMLPRRSGALVGRTYSDRPPPRG